MKALKKMLEPLSGWVRARPLWAVGLLLLGWLVALLMAGASTDDRNFLLNVVTAAGTLGAALAAFLAVRLTILDREKRASHEAELRKPYLQITEVDREEGDALITFVNLSQSSIFVVEVATVTEMIPLPQIRPVGKVVPASGSVVYRYALDIRLAAPGAGTLFFYFHHALTGVTPYRVGLPIKVEWRASDGAIDTTFYLSKQKLEHPHEFSHEVERSSGLTWDGGGMTFYREVVSARAPAAEAESHKPDSSR